MKLYQAFSFLVCLFLYSGMINAATEGKDPNSEVIHFLNNQRSTEKAKTEKEQTEMTLLDPLRSSERCL